MKTQSPLSVGDIVRVRAEFEPFIQLSEAHDPEYRRKCRKSYVYTPEDMKFFDQLYKGISGRLRQKKRNLLILGPFGVGKSINLMLAYDIFISKYNADVLDHFPETLRHQLASLTHENPYLVIRLMGTQISSSLHDALIQALSETIPKDIELETDFTDAQRWLEWLDEPSQADLKDRFKNALTGIDSAMDLDMLKNHLPGRIEYLGLLRKVYEKAMGRAYPRLTAANPSDAYQAAVKQLVGPAKRYSGILILFDEFGQYITDRATSDDFTTLTAFGEWVHTRDRVFMVVATQTIPERFDSQVDYERFKTFEGRCEERYIDRAYYEDLIAGALEEIGGNKDCIKLTAGYWNELAGLQRRVHPLYPHDAQKAVWGYYPFHPGLIAALRPISDRLGQYERTIFLYIDPTNEEGLASFLKEVVFLSDGRLNLLTLDRIFDYFEEAIERDNPDIYSRYQQAYADIRGDDTSEQVLKLVTLLHLLGGLAPLQPTAQNITTLLYEPDQTRVESALATLTDKEHVFPEGSVYRLASPGAITRKTVEAKVGQLQRQDASSVDSAEVIGHVRDYTRNALKVEPSRVFPFKVTEPYISQMYLNKYKIYRRFQPDFLGWRELVRYADDVDKDLKALDYSKMSVLFGVVTEDENEKGTALNQIRAAAGRLAKRGFIVGVPKSPLSAIDTVKAVRAVSKISTEQPFTGTSALEQAQKARLKDLLDALDAHFSVQNFEWYTPLGKNLPSPSRVEDVIDSVTMHYGSKFPEGVKYADLLGERVNTEVVHRLSKRTFGIAKKAKKADQIINDALIPIGIVVKGKGKPADLEDPAQVVAPNKTTHPRSNEAWDKIRAALPPGISHGDRIAKLRDELSSRPYWFPPDVGVYFLAAFLATEGGKIRVNGYEQPRDADNLKSLWGYPSDYSIVIPIKVPLDSTTRSYLDTLGKAVAANISAPRYSGSLLSPVPQTVLEPEIIAELASDVESWWREYGIKVKAKVEDWQISLTPIAQAWLDALGESVPAKSQYDADFYLKTLPDKANMGGKLATLATELHSTISQLEGLTKEVFELDWAIIKKGELLARAEEFPEVQKAWDNCKTNVLDSAARSAFVATVKQASARTLTPEAEVTPVVEVGGEERALTAEIVQELIDVLQDIANQLKQGTCPMNTSRQLIELIEGKLMKPHSGD